MQIFKNTSSSNVRQCNLLINSLIHQKIGSAVCQQINVCSNKGEVHCRSIFSGLKEVFKLSIKQLLLFSRTPPSLRKQRPKIQSCTPSSQIMMELEEACSQIATEIEELYSQFVMQMKNLTRSLLCRIGTLLVVYSGMEQLGSQL